MMSQTFFRAALALLLGAGAACLAAGAAGAATCEIPARLLCSGCASNIKVVVGRNGSCRVSFSPGAGVGASAQSVRIEIAPELRTRIARRTHHGRRHFVSRLHRMRADAAAPVAGGVPRCFVFNERRYCE